MGYSKSLSVIVLLNLLFRYFEVCIFSRTPDRLHFGIIYIGTVRRIACQFQINPYSPSSIVINMEMWEMAMDHLLKADKSQYIHSACRLRKYPWNTLQAMVMQAKIFPSTVNMKYVRRILRY